MFVCVFEALAEFEIVKIILVFISVSHQGILKTRQQNMICFVMGGSVPRTAPKSKIAIFHYMYAKFSPPKSDFGDFQGGVARTFKYLRVIYALIFKDLLCFLLGNVRMMEIYDFYLVENSHISLEVCRFW